eukprot:gene13736-4016_t
MGQGSKEKNSLVERYTSNSWRKLTAGELKDSAVRLSRPQKLPAIHDAGLRMEWETPPPSRISNKSPVSPRASPRNNATSFVDRLYYHDVRDKLASQQKNREQVDVACQRTIIKKSAEDIDDAITRLSDTKRVTKIGTPLVKQKQKQKVYSPFLFNAPPQPLVTLNHLKESSA